MTNESASRFSAVDPTLGYLYQIRVALLWSLRRLKNDPVFLVSLETLDDVTFETIGGDPKDLLQIKHHQRRTCVLTDASPDLWKTLRIWFEGRTSGILPSDTNLCLITTSITPDGTAASRLRSSPRDVVGAEQALDATASSSTNVTNFLAYQAYLAASPSERIAVLSKVVVFDATPSVTDIESELYQEIYWAVKKEYHSAFLERLEGWWLRRVLQQLTDAPTGRIGSVEIEAQMSDLREQFKQEALPIDDDLLEFNLDNTTRVAYENLIFVRQLDLIKAGKHRITAAIRDYYRAFEQRSRWLRNDLVVGMDLHKYEKRLIEEWELVFEAMRDELGDTATEDAKEKAARSILEWVEQTIISIRTNVTEPFVSRGSFHILSDKMRIGWHPEFRDRIALLLKKGTI